VASLPADVISDSLPAGLWASCRTREKVERTSEVVDW